MVVPMGSPEWLFDHVVDDPHLQKVARRKLQCRSGFLCMFGTLPKNPGTAFGTDDGIIGVFQNRYSVTDSNSESTSAAAFTNDHADDRRLQSRHLIHVFGDDLSLPTLFSSDAGISSWRVDHADHGQSIFLGHSHFGHRLAVAFWMGATKMSFLSVIECPAFLMADHHHFNVTQ